MSVLNRTISEYEAWGRPWLFYEHVSTSPSLSAEERDIFAQMWNEATDARHWMRSDLGECAKQAEIALLGIFPRLDNSSAELIARAAAYQWR